MVSISTFQLILSDKYTEQIGAKITVFSLIFINIKIS